MLIDDLITEAKELATKHNIKLKYVLQAYGVVALQKMADKFPNITLKRKERANAKGEGSNSNITETV